MQEKPCNLSGRSGDSLRVDGDKGPVDLSPKCDGGSESKTETGKDGQPMLWPAWVYCTRYSDRPSSGTFLYVYLRQLV